jgi:hypothetical protein
VAESEARNARLERAWTSLSSHPETKITVAALAREAGCSNTYACRFRRQKLDMTKRTRKNAAMRPVSEPIAPGLEARDELQSTLLKLASVAQDQVGQLIQILDVAVSPNSKVSSGMLQADAERDRQKPANLSERLSDDRNAGTAPYEARHNKPRQASSQVPFVETKEAPLAASADALSPAPTPRRRRGNRVADPSQLMLGLEWSSSGGSPNTDPWARQPEIHQAGGRITSVAHETIDVISAASNSSESDATGQVARSVIASTADILRNERGPLGAFAIGERLRNLGELSLPKKRLKDVLLTGCPTHFEHEAASEKFWANVTGISKAANGQPMSIRTAAVIEAVKQIDKLGRPAEMKDLYSCLPEQIRLQITHESFDLALKTADTGLGDLRQNEGGRWFLAQHGDLDPFVRRPTKMYGPLRRALLKILTASQFSLPPAKILAALPERIARHFTATNIEKHLAAVSRGLSRDPTGYLSIRSAMRPNMEGKRRISLGKLARTAAVVDAAIDRLEAERRALSLDELYESKCGIPRDAFRKAMNQRQKSSNELERIDEGRYRYNPVLV